MRVWVQVVQHLRPGGIETMALDLQRLQQADERGIIVSLEGRREEALAAWPRLMPYAERLVFLDKAPGVQLTTITQLARLLKRWRATSVHTHHIGPLIYGGIAARLAGVKLVMHTEHDAWHLRQAKRRLLQSLVVRWVKPLLVADADLVANELRHNLGLAEARVQVIKNGIDLAHFCPGNPVQARLQLGLPIGVTLIGCAGRLEQEKGQATLLEAMRLLPADVHLALAGDGSKRAALQQLAIDSGMAERIHFLGAIDAMPSFYQALDLYCSPSFFEGLSLVILEAQACGVPVVATDVGASSEALCPRTGALIKPRSAFAMAQALEERLACGERGNPRQFVKQVGDLNTTIAHYSAMRQRFA